MYIAQRQGVHYTLSIGYPVPELKWYKDDMEMDRYCGLPKYEIHRNGKIHTLHIYNCTLDDAAIYQASASNSKGIVSCSGVLEVGSMNEFKIHQQFFAKLKQKAEKKRRDLEEQIKKADKEIIQKEKGQSSLERPQRKRPIPRPPQGPVFKEPKAVEQQVAAAKPNGVSSEVKEMALVSSIDSGLEKEIPSSDEALAKKKIKISNGVDAGVNGSSSSISHMMGIGGENCYDEGIILDQFLTDTLQSQIAEEVQNSSQEEKPKELDISIVNASKEEEREQEREEQEKGPEREYEREKRREEEMDIENLREKERPSVMSYTVAHHKPHGKTHKDHEHHNIQTSISSMLSTVKGFFFGKSKKESRDHIDKKEREWSPQPEMPPSFRVQLEHDPDMYKPLTEDAVPMEMDKPKESSTTADIQQQSVSLEMHEHGHEDSVLCTHLPQAPKLSPESIEEPTGKSVKEADDVGEAMEVSVAAGSSSPGEEMPLSGLQILTETEDKDSQIVSVSKEAPVNQQEPVCLVVSLLPRDESSPTEDTFVLPQIKAAHEEEYIPVSTLTRLEESWTLPHSVISVSDRHSLGETPTETFQEEKISVDKMGTEAKHDREEGWSSNKLSEEEKAEVKSSKGACLDINRSEITELTAFSLEEEIKPCESKTPVQVLSPLSAWAAYSAERENVKEEAKHVSTIQETNVGFPPTAAPERLEKDDLNIERECTPSAVEERTEGHNLSAVQSSESGYGASEERSDLKEIFSSALEKDLEVNNQKTDKNTILEHECMNERLLFEVETEKKGKWWDESQMLSATQNERNDTNVLEERSNVADQEGSERHLGWPLENIPQIQISTTEDTPNVKQFVPDVSTSEHVIIPEPEIMEPEFKECTLPLTLLALNKPESDILQKHDATHVSEMIIQDQKMANSPGWLVTQKDMQNDYNISLTEKIKDVAQLDDETEVFEREQPYVKSSEQLPQMDNVSIPDINVSCTDNKADDTCVNAQPSHTLQPFETPVVPPISVTCYENDPGLRLPTHSRLTETETSVATQRGTKHDADNDMITKPEKTQSRKQNIEEKAENSVKDKTPSLLYEALIPKFGDNVQSFSKPAEGNGLEIFTIKPLKQAKIEVFVSVDHVQGNKSCVKRLSSKAPTHPSLSPASLRKLTSKAAPDPDNEAVKAVPVITVGDHQNDKADEDLSGSSTPTFPLSRESSPRLKRRDSLSLIRSATPEELASGARRKIFIPKTKEDGDGALVGVLDTQGKKDTPYMSPSQVHRATLLQTPPGPKSPPMERRSPLLSRKKATLEVPKLMEDTPREGPTSPKKEEKPSEKKPDPLKAPQVIRKVRGEPFPDASGHLKLWCQFFNVLSDSTIKWYRDEEEILELKRSGGDESQVALAIVLASSQDCGVYGCTINNEYGTDTTDFLLSTDILSEILLKDDLEVGEEIEMTPLLFTKGLADCGSWGDKYFGRIMTETVHIGEGCAHKAGRVKVIYGLDPVFESGRTSIIKIKNPIAYGTKQGSNLAERNLEITKHECKVQNMIREYCKIFAAETRVIENFGCALEVIPRYLMYRPANSVPYATVEADLEGVFQKYCAMDPKGRLVTQTVYEVEQKCATFQHWIHQWTHGNLLVTRLEGVETKLTNVGVVTKSKGYQGLSEYSSPEVFEQFLTHHQCNYYCGLLGLRPLKSMDSQQPTKMKGSKSPLLNRKLGSSSPQMAKRSSPKVPRKVQETGDIKSDVNTKPVVAVQAIEMR